MVWVVAHQGGWDEALLFGLPIVLALVVINMIDRKVVKNRGKGRQQDEGQRDQTDEHPDPT